MVVEIFRREEEKRRERKRERKREKNTNGLGEEWTGPVPERIDNNLLKGKRKKKMRKIDLKK